MNRIINLKPKSAKLKSAQQIMKRINKNYFEKLKERKIYNNAAFNPDVFLLKQPNLNPSFLKTKSTIKKIPTKRNFQMTNQSIRRVKKE